jgi:hypothetical protein
MFIPGKITFRWDIRRLAYFCKMKAATLYGVMVSVPSDTVTA